MPTEPNLLYCTQRDAVDAYGCEEIHLECRFDDGQKGAMVTVDADFPELAQRIADFLNAKAATASAPARPPSLWVRVGKAIFE